MDNADYIVLMDAARLRRTLKRMAYEIAELNNLNRQLILLGINRRGYAVAKELEAMLNDISDDPAEVLQLKLKNGEIKTIKDSIPTVFGTYNKPMFVVVDDVIFSGQTMFNALLEVAKQLHPSEMHTATLIDRGHRRFPIQAEFCGMRLPTKRNEHVKVEVKKMEVQKILLLNSDY